MSAHTRREILQRLSGLGVVGATAAVSGCYYPYRVAQHNRRRNAIAAQAGQPINFATQSQRITRSIATTIARTPSQLIEAVNQPGATVWIPPGVTIDMTGEFLVPVASNVTIASSRSLGSTKQPSGLIKTTGYDTPVFEHTTGRLRVTGLRLKGPRTDHFDPWKAGESHEDYSACAFKTSGATAIIDNCEVFGWTFAGFSIGAQKSPTSGWLHHNAMHHNQMAHLGYPMELYNGEHLIEWNYFNYNRHSIAGFGHPQNGYEARYNVVGPKSRQHAFDMHWLGENLDNNNELGGKYINVHHNVFTLDESGVEALSIQGKPRQQSQFSHNWCLREPSEQSLGLEAIARQIRNPASNPTAITDSTSFYVQGNNFGATAVKKGRTWLRKKAKQQHSPHTNTTNKTTQ